MQASDDYAAWMPEGAIDEAAEQAEQQYLKASIPLIQDVLDWYDEMIAEFKNPEVITGVNVSTPEKQVKEAVLFAQQQIASYRKKKNEFAHRFSEYIEEPSQG